VGATTANTGAFTTLSATGVTTVQAGSAAAPAITTTGDTNTGIFFPAADTIAFTEGGAEVARFDSSGRFGIGTNAPGAKLEVIQNTSSGTGIRQVSASASTAFSSDFASLSLQNTDTTNGNYNTLGFVNDQGGFSAAIHGVYTSHTAGSQSGAMVFSTSNAGSFSERARINSSGDLLVGRTTSIGGSRFTVEADTTTLNPMAVSNSRSSAATDYSVLFYRNGSLVGSIQTSLSDTTYVTTSDYRLKEDIQPMTGALAKVAQLKPCTYKWKATGADGQGFIAHELQEVVPTAVAGLKDGLNPDGSIKPQGIDTSFLVATLTAAIQELKAEFDAYKAAHP